MEIEKIALLDTDFISKTHISHSDADHLIDRVLTIPEYKFFCHAQVKKELSHRTPYALAWLEDKINAAMITCCSDSEILDELETVYGSSCCYTYRDYLQKACEAFGKKHYDNYYAALEELNYAETSKQEFLAELLAADNEVGKQNTQAAYEGNIYRHIIPQIGKIPLNELSQSDLQQFYAKMKSNGRLTKRETFGKGISDSVVRKMHAICRSALEKAVEDGFIRTNPAISCKLPPKKSAEMQVLTQEEMQRFLIQAKYDGDYELYLLELATGMRIGEILGLQWDDLNFKTGMVCQSSHLS